jgi:hypothetical protein
MDNYKEGFYSGLTALLAVALLAIIIVAFAFHLM